MAIYRAVTRGQAQGQQFNTTTSWSRGGSPSNADASYLAQQVQGSWSAFILPVLSTSYTTLGTDVQSIDNPLIGSFAAGSGGAGQKTGDPMPTYVTARVRWVTGFRGWAARGRIGFGPLAESQVNGNQLFTNEGTAIVSAIASFLNNVKTGEIPFDQVVISTIVDGAPRPTPIFQTVQSFVVSSRVGTQLQRKDG